MFYKESGGGIFYVKKTKHSSLYSQRPVFFRLCEEQHDIVILVKSL